MSSPESSPPPIPGSVNPVVLEQRRHFDRAAPVLDEPYPPAEEGDIPHHERADFEALMARVTGRTGQRDGPYWEANRRQSAEEIEAAIQANPNLRVTLQAWRRTIAHNYRQEHTDDSGNILRITGAAADAAAARQGAARAQGQVSAAAHELRYGAPAPPLAKRRLLGRLGLGTVRHADGRRLIVTRGHKDRVEHDRATNAVNDRNLALVDAQLASERARKRAANIARNAAAEERKYLGLEEILARVPSLGPGENMKALEARHGTAEWQQTQTRELVMDWRASSHPHDELRVYQHLDRLTTYLQDVDTAITDATPHGTEYGDLVRLRTKLMRTYIAGRYRKEQLGIEHGNIHGRDTTHITTAHYRDDKGIELNDGSGLVLYPDGTYGNRDAKGRYWLYTPDGFGYDDMDDEMVEMMSQPPFEADLPAVPPQSASTYDGYVNALDAWFATQTPSSTVEARNQARRIKDWSFQAAASDPTNTAARRRGNVAAYWEAYLSKSAGEPPDPSDTTHTMDNGNIIQFGEYYGVNGMWVLRADGSMQHVYHDRATGHLVRGHRYTPDGVRY